MNVVIRELSEKDALLAFVDQISKPDFIRTLQACMYLSTDAWIGEVDDKPVCGWGLIPPSLMSNRAYIWLLTTEEVEFHKFTFIRQSQIWVKHMLKTYDSICGHCMVDNNRGIRWLKWLGAEFGHPDGRGIPFEIRKREWPTRSQSAHSRL